MNPWLTSLKFALIVLTISALLLTVGAAPVSTITTNTTSAKGISVNKISTSAEITTLNRENVFPDNKKIGDEIRDNNVSDIGYINVTQSTGDNNKTAEPGRFHSSFNLALIPVAAAVVFFIVICLKCCQWFRRYTRGGSKDEGYYAEIVQDGDDDHMDILSDTTSTANFDTVSSFCSFLRRSGNEGTLTSLRSFKLDTDTFSGSPKKWLLAKLRHQRTIDEQLKSPGINSDTDSVQPLRKLQRQRTITGGTCSTSSSEETDIIELDPLNSSDASILRKQNRFRVSFVTDNYNANSKPPRLHTPQDSIDSIIGETKPPNLKRSSQKPTSISSLASCSSKRSVSNDIVKPSMVTVGTQTNKTFMNSLKNAQLRHCSKDNKKHSPIKTELLVSAEIVRVDSIEGDSIHNKTGQGNVINESSNNTRSTCLPKKETIDKGHVPYQMEHSVKVCIEHSSCINELTETDFADDVFVLECDTDGVSNSLATCSRCYSNKNANKMQGIYTEGDGGINNSSEQSTPETIQCKNNCPRNYRLSECDNCVVYTNATLNQSSPSLPVTTRQEHVNVSCISCPTLEHRIDVRLDTNTNSSETKQSTSPHIDTNSMEGDVEKLGRASPCLIEQTNDSVSAICIDTDTTSIGILQNDRCSSPAVCHNCGMLQDVRQSPRRHNSVISDYRSSSVTSLESSGYAEELSFDGSE